MTPQEIRILGRGCRQAKKYGLFRDFKEHYRSYRGMKVPVADAVYDALYDWDLLEIVKEDDRGISLGLLNDGEETTP
jgi:hypothetical protein